MERDGECAAEGLYTEGGREGEVCYEWWGRVNGGWVFFPVCLTILKKSYLLFYIFSF